MKKKTNRILTGFAAVFFIICIIEGMVYYPSKYDNWFVVITLNLQNAVKAFLLSSNIEIGDVTGLLESENTWVRLYQYLYILVITLAPVCTAAAIVTALKWISLRLAASVRMGGGKRVAVIGKSDEAKNMAAKAAEKNKAAKKTEKYQPFLYVGKDFDREKGIALLKKGVQIVEGNYLEGNDAFEKQKLERCPYIALMEKNALDNFNALDSVASYLSKKRLTEKITCLVMCDDSSVAGMIEDYYTKKVKDIPDLKAYFELVIWNPFQLEAIDILKRKPMYTYQLAHYEESVQPVPADFWNTHMVIAGFGRLGQQLLLQTLNMGVLHSKADMRFDVYDYRMEEKLGSFMKNFCVGAVKHRDPDHITIPFPDSGGGSMDGRVEIYFHQADINTNAFEDSLNIISAEMPLTYAAVCFDESTLAMAAMLSIEKALSGLSPEEKKGIPLVVHLEGSKGIGNFLQNDRRADQHSSLSVYISREREEILELNNIRKYTEDDYALKFNYRYDQISLYISERKDGKNNQGMTGGESEKEIQASWRKMPLVKQQSSRALALHSDVKLLRVAEYAYSWRLRKESKNLSARDKKDEISFEAFWSEWKQRKKEETSFEKFWDELNAERRNEQKQDEKMLHMEGSLSGLLAPVNREPEEILLETDTNQLVGELKDDRKQDLRELAALEHRRWCQYMISVGYRYGEGAKDDDRKTNPCLLDWEELSEKQPEYCRYDLPAYLLLAPPQHAE